MLDVEKPLHHFYPLAPTINYAWLNQLALLDVIGDDARAFLHSQLTHDVDHLALTRVKRAAYCNPQGRVLATLYYWRIDRGVRALLAADLLDSIQKRLAMFVLRRQVRLEKVSDTSIVGVICTTSTAIHERLSHWPQAEFTHAEDEPTTLVRLPGIGGYQRGLWMVPRAWHDTEQLKQYVDTQVDSTIWDWCDICAGEPRVTAATQGQWIPQMLNWELLDGVDFKKGCYPGQEVIARSQYRGTIKRRMRLATTLYASAGADVFYADDPQQPCGKIVNAAYGPDGQCHVLVEIKLAACGQPIYVERLDGPLLTWCRLPYLIPEILPDQRLS